MFDTFTKNARGITQRPTLPPSVFAIRHYSHGWKLTGLFLNSGFWGWRSTERQPQNPYFGRFLWLLWFNFSLSVDNLAFKLENVDIFRHTASFKTWFSNFQDFGNFELPPMYSLQSDQLQRIAKLLNFCVAIFAISQKRWSEFVDAQACLRLCCWHLAKYGFLATTPGSGLTH